MSLSWLIFISGVLHFGTLLASAAVPQVLDWRAQLNKLDPLSRKIVWVHGAFIVLTIIGFGVLTIRCSDQLASGAPLARAVCGFIALFWGARLVVQFTVLDAYAYLTTPLLKLGYHALTLVFLYQTLLLGWTAVMTRVAT